MPPLTEGNSASAAPLPDDLPLQGVVRHVPLAIAIFDREMRYLFVSDRWLADYGPEGENVIGRSHYEVFPDLPPHWKPIHRRAMAGETVSEDCEPFTDRRGKLHFIRWAVRPWSQSGRIQGITIIAEDVTDAVYSVRQLEEARDKFALAFRNAPVALSITRLRDGSFVEVNEAFERMFLRTPAEVIGKTSAELNMWVDPSKRADYYSALKKTGRIVNFRMRFQDSTGRVGDANVSSGVTVIDGEPCCMNLAADVTQTLALEARLTHASRMEAIGCLAGGIAHDFNNILGIILGSSELAQRAASPDCTTRHYLDEIVIAARRAGALTRQLLTFARKDDAASGTLDLVDALQKAVGLVRRLIDAAIRIDLSLPDDELMVAADFGQIEQIVMNLLINARDAMPAGGAVRISLRASQTNGHATAVLEVQDFGIGMSESVKARVFDPFFTTKGVGNGTGLGLSIVYGTVQKLNGSIELESELGRGSRFRITLPQAATPARRADAAPRACSHCSGKRVLVVEDEPMLRQVVEEMLRSQGMSVQSVADAGAARLLLEAPAEPDDLYDLLVSDVQMPGISGIDLLRQVRAFLPHLPVILISGYFDSSALPEDEQDRVFVLNKPFTLASLTGKVEEALTAAIPQ